ncbi:hypothetical protein TNIN_205601 [Trichonephila inaurata madagascariensis]|uniref:Uncharacterized protein n=1 Tax=Trichonephila inaurata madagascariensis TaxID=2747483 RepID=A0A8X7C9U1_9ARAC|nr:hypothetical protein TNIN_205601 [Trichonephila inaurata madagascariensis]
MSAWIKFLNLSKREIQALKIKGMKRTRLEIEIRSGCVCIPRASPQDFPNELLEIGGQTLGEVLDFEIRIKCLRKGQRACGCK